MLVKKRNTTFEIQTERLELSQEELSTWIAPSVVRKVTNDYDNGIFSHSSSSISWYIKTFPEIDAYCESMLKNIPQFETKGHVICCILFPNKRLKKCKICGEYISYTIDKHRNWNASFCCKECAMTDEGKKIQVELFNKSTGGINPMTKPEIKQKLKDSILKKYGVDNIGKLPEYRKKAIQTTIERYGVDNYFKSDSIVQNTKKRNFQKLVLACHKKELKPLFDEEFYLNSVRGVSDFKFECLNCHDVFSIKLSGSQLFYLKCMKCYPPIFGSSNGERELSEWLSKYVKCDCNDRKILEGRELDIVIPEKKVAIEYNGLFWHSESCGKDKDYHIDKTNACLEKGYQLIHIFEDEWVEKQAIVKRRLKNVLGLVTYKIGARKCEIREVNNELSKKFLDKYHLQGSINSSIRLGLFYNNRLVALMTFSKPRFNGHYDWELTRYCTIGSFSIVGGASKLLSYFKKHYDGSIISYADRRWSNGNLYKKLGFVEVCNTKPNYYYVKNGVRYNRMTFQKHKLKDVLETFDEQLTESENMELNNFVKIWDCGNKVFSSLSYVV